MARRSLIPSRDPASRRMREESDRRKLRQMHARLGTRKPGLPKPVPVTRPASCVGRGAPHGTNRRVLLLVPCGRLPGVGADDRIQAKGQARPRADGRPPPRTESNSREPRARRAGPVLSLRSTRRTPGRSVKRVGGSLGVALLAVVLEHRVPGGSGALADRAAPASTVTEAFAATFWWALALSALALIPAALLPRRPAAVSAQRARPDRRHRHLHGLTESG